MSPLEAFDDERLNADLAAILGLRAGGDTPSIDQRLSRRRTALREALRSPHASATIGVSFFIAMLGTTAFLMYHPFSGQSDKATPRPVAPQPIARKETPSPSPVAARVDAVKSPTALAASPSDGASHVSRRVRPAPWSRRKANPQQDDATIDVAATGDRLSTPVLVGRGEGPTDRGAADLARYASPLPLLNVEVSADGRSVAPAVPDDDGGKDRSARVRRNSVSAIRALRRQW
jgi:hypothetical protein